MSKKKKPPKRKFALWVDDSTLELARSMYEKDNCSSQSEFISKAIIFYAGYLSSENNTGYLPNIVTSTLKSIVAESDNRISRMIFKLAVELAVAMNVIASNNDISEIEIARLRGNCVEAVKRINGIFTFDNAHIWQED